MFRLDPATFAIGIPLQLSSHEKEQHPERKK
jgi:hypothetical protein